MRLLINTGGKGARLYPLTLDLPKPMIPFGGKPLLAHLVDWAKANGITEIVMLNGYLHERIEDYFQDGSLYGIPIRHSNEPYPLGSGGSVKNASKYITSTTILINGDLLCDVNLSKMLDAHRSAKDPIMTALVRTSSHPEDSDLLGLDGANHVVRFVGKHEDHANAGNLTNAGLFILEPRILDYMNEEKFTFETYLYPALIEAGECVNAYISDEVIEDVGTPQRLAEAEGRKMRKAVFLDRDGVINEDTRFVYDMREVSFISGSIEALQLLSKTDYIPIIISNASAVGRGLCTEAQYLSFNKQYLEKLEEQSIRVQKSYYCFHHPTAGIGKYKTECGCRKPGIGLITEAQQQFCIDLNNSFFIGDKRSDVMAGKTAGCTTILVSTGYGGKGGEGCNVEPDYHADDLMAAVRLILKIGNNT